MSLLQKKSMETNWLVFRLKGQIAQVEHFMGLYPITRASGHDNIKALEQSIEYVKEEYLRWKAHQ